MESLGLSRDWFGKILGATATATGAVGKIDEPAMLIAAAMGPSTPSRCPALAASPSAAEVDLERILIVEAALLQP